MKENKDCPNCRLRNKCRDSAWSWVFLFIGIIAAVAMRLVALFMHNDPGYAKLSWYVGVGFFFIFFVYRYNISRLRNNILRDNELLTKINDGSPLSKEDRIVLGQLLCSLNSKKERINYIFIFVLSAIAFLAAVIADLFL